MWNMFKVNIKDTRKMSNVALLVSLLLTLNIFHTFLYSVSSVEFEQLSADWQLRYVASLDINRTCMRFVNLWLVVYEFVLYFHDTNLHECLISRFSTTVVLNYVLLAWQKAAKMLSQYSAWGNKNQLLFYLSYKVDK